MDVIFSTFEVIINTVKTKVMVCNKQNEPNISITHKGNIIKQASQFKYLRTIINNDRRSEKEITSIIWQAKRHFQLSVNYLLQKIWIAKKTF